jgi:hypothetical protein
MEQRRTTAAMGATEKLTRTTATRGWAWIIKLMIFWAA